MSNRAQISAEFMILAAIALVFFGLLLYAYVQTSTKAKIMHDEDVALSTAKTLAHSIDVVSLSANGTTRLIYIPRQNYTITINPELHLVECYWSQGYASYPFSAFVSIANITDANVTIRKTDTGVSLT